MVSNLQKLKKSSHPLCLILDQPVLAFIAFDGSISFLVTAWKNENGKISCMYSATDETEKMFNLQDKGYMEKLDLCSDTKKQLKNL